MGGGRSAGGGIAIASCASVGRGVDALDGDAFSEGELTEAGIGCGVADAAGSDLTAGGGDGKDGGKLASTAGLIAAEMWKVTILDFVFGVLAAPFAVALVFMAPAIVMVVSRSGGCVMGWFGVEANCSFCLIWYLIQGTPIVSVNLCAYREGWVIMVMKCCR